MNELDNKSINFLLADDHSLIRQGVIFVLEEIGFDYEVFHASNLQQTMETVEKHPIDIVIIDAHFPDGNSLTVLPQIRKAKPEIKILVFTGIDESVHSLKYINAGANGFLSKMNEEDQIQNAIMKIKNDGEYISPVTQALLMNSLHNGKQIDPLSSLTEREMQIARMYAEGLGNLEIASKLDVKQNTVSTVKKRIFDKLKVENIVELIELIKNHS